MLPVKGEIPGGVRSLWHSGDGSAAQIEVALRFFRPGIAKAKEEIRRRGGRMVIVVDGEGLIAHPLIDDARRAIAPFAELERAPEHIHTYRITPLALWNARAAGLSEREVVSALGLLELAGRVGREGESWRRARASDRRATSLDA